MLALVMPLGGCGGTTDVVLVLNGISVAANAAVPFAGQYAPFVRLAADGAQMAANELMTQDPASIQYSKIVADLTDLTNQFPDVTNADPQTRDRIQAIESAVKAAVQLVENLLAKGKTLAMASPAARAQVRAVADVPVKLTPKDAKLIVEIHRTASAVERKLAK